MNDYLRHLVEKYRSRGALIDSNLLLVYLIGRCDPDLIPAFKRTQKFARRDFEILAGIVTYFARIIVTPHILTEVSNLSGQLTDKRLDRCRIELRGMISEILDEKYVPATEIVPMSAFPELGLTDAGIERLAPDTCLVLTDDFPLSNRLQTLRIDAINYNHIRFPIGKW